MKITRDFSSFFCPNQSCSAYNQLNSGNIVYRSFTGSRKDILRLKCKECGKEFSERRFTMLEGSHLTPETVARIFRCIRWGVCREGIADICQINIKTVDSYLEKGAKQGQAFHEENVKDLTDAAVQLDEAHGKVSGKGANWLAAAIACQSLLIVAFVTGKRDQELADRLLCRVLSAFSKIPMFLSDGWAPYAAAVCRLLGEMYRPFKKTAYRLRCRWILFARVIKKRDKRGKLEKVHLEALMGGIEKCCYYFLGYKLGNIIHTIHIERWFGTLRAYVKGFQRRTRFLPKTFATQENAVWLYITFYNWFIPHTTLSKRYNHFCTPAMAAGLTSCVLSIEEWIRRPVRRIINPKLAVYEKLAADPEREKAYKRSAYSKGKPITKDYMDAIAC